MIAVVQRVVSASVSSEGTVISRIGHGALVLLGVARGDGMDDALRLAARISSLRYFDDPGGKRNHSIAEAGGAFLVVSQFTLCADCRKGTRPSYTEAAPGEEARPLYEAFSRELRRLGHEVATGVFGAHMRVALENDGPVTLIVQT